MRIPRFIILLAFAVVLAGQQTPAPANSTEIFERAKAATVVVLAGEGAGRLHSVSTGVTIANTGIILTAYHAIKGAAEIQVRTADGEVFDRVLLTGFDERRDVAALKISAGGLAALPLGSTAKIAQGDPVYAVTNEGGLTWSATQGIVSAIRPADEIPGAGSGFRLVQFTAPVAPGSSGGALVDRTGSLIGIITSQKGPAAFAVPIESVIGLPNSGVSVALGSGTSLQLPAKAAILPASSAAVAASDPKQALRNAKTIFIRSKTTFLTVDTLDRALAVKKDWPKLGLTIVQDQRVADLLIEIDRPLFTYIHTFVIVDKKTSAVLDSGKVTALDGTLASNGIADDLVKIFLAVRVPPPPTK
ncbi:MAG TPA: S1C family serine protease [Bryobacteraceae bacterium]|jgi:hypothetical protein